MPKWKYVPSTSDPESVRRAHEAEAAKRMAPQPTAEEKEADLAAAKESAACNAADPREVHDVMLDYEVQPGHQIWGANPGEGLTLNPLAPATSWYLEIGAVALKETAISDEAESEGVS